MLLSAAHQHNSVNAAAHRRNGEFRDVRRSSLELHTTSPGVGYDATIPCVCELFPRGSSCLEKHQL